MWIPQIGMPRAWIILLKQMKKYLSFICTDSKGHANLVKSVLKCAKLQRVAIIDVFLIRTDTNPDNRIPPRASCVLAGCNFRARSRALLSIRKIRDCF